MCLLLRVLNEVMIFVDFRELDVLKWLDVFNSPSSSENDMAESFFLADSLSYLDILSFAYLKSA
jgi:hypothetical protein